MSISIRNIRSAKLVEWDHIWQECDYSTYFHSREWAEIWNVYTKGKMYPDPKLIVFSDGKKVLLPLSCRRSLKGLVKNYISSPAKTFGGWISVDDIDINHAAPISRFLTKELGNLVWRINPYDKLVLKSGVKISEDDETQALNLENSFDTIYRQWTKGHRSAVHKAYKAGISVKPASTLKEWQLYYNVYEDSLQRWGDEASSRYDWEIFREMFQRNSKNIKLWLAIYENEVIAGAIVFYAKKHVVYWHGAALEKHFNLRPVNLLIYEAVKHACEKGYSWFDFNPSSGHEGTKAFKRSFAAEALPCPVVRSEVIWEKIAKNLLGSIRKGKL